MPVFHDSALIGAAGASGAVAGGYQISRSLRFNSSDSAFLSRTPASAGNRKTWTWAGWVKRSKLGTSQGIFNASVSTANYALLEFNSSDKIVFSDVIGSGNVGGIFETTGVYRDAGAWYHVVAAFDSTQGTTSDRFKLYINGVEAPGSQTTAFKANFDGQINNAIEHRIGRWITTFGDYLNGYLADIHFIDGQALTPSSFTEVSATTGQLIPKAYTGSYGTNGFRLPFSDNSGTTATTLGKDAAGSNNWTPTNFSVASGAGNDSLVDTPTSYGTDTGAGGEVRGNYATLNPLVNFNSSTLSNGNLDIVCAAVANQWRTQKGGWGFYGGKFYFEATFNAGPSPGGSAIGIGRITLPHSGNLYPGQSAGSYAYGSDGAKVDSGSISAFWSTWTVGDVIGVATDLMAGTVAFYKNGTLQGSMTGLDTTLTYEALVGGAGSTASQYFLNFGQRPFAYTAPSGFKALCDTNLPAPVVAKPNTVMDVALWTGNGSARSITGLGFNPDLVWIKGRSGATDHALYDAVRGAQSRLESNNTDAEVTSDGGVTAFNSDGFSLGTLAQVNTNTATYAGWAWDAGSSTVTNNSGSITGVQVRANASAGCSVLTYTGNGTAGATVGHGLGVAPSLIIVKKRSAADDWVVYHSSLGATRHLLLQSTAAQNTGTNRWNDTAPTNTVFSLGSSNSTNGNGSTFVTYAWAPVAGLSAFGSYTGNGSADGPLVHLGFRPAVVMVKMSSSTGNWTILDDKREGYNVDNDPLYPNLADAEGTTDLVDITSNGFKVRTTDASFNTNTGTYVYAAWASAPFQYARAR